MKDAAGKVSPRALEAALVETGSSFDLSGKDLIALQDAKVPGSVTDLMIALSYPDRFVVERRRADAAPATPFSDDPFFVGWSFGYPMWWDYGFYSPLYGPYSPYFYSPFYSYLPWYSPPYATVAAASSSSAMAMDPEEEGEVAAVVVFSQADVGGSLMASGTRASAHAKRSRRHTVRPVPPHRPRADLHLRQAAVVAAACRARASRVAVQEATAAAVPRNRGKIPGCMTD